MPQEKKKSLLEQALERDDDTTLDGENLTPAPIQFAQVPDDEQSLSLLQLAIQQRAEDDRLEKLVIDQEAFKTMTNAQRIDFLSTREVSGRYPNQEDFIDETRLDASGIRVGVAALKAVEGTYDGWTVTDADLGRFGVSALDAKNALPLESTARTGLSGAYTALGSVGSLGLRTLIGGFEAGLAITKQTLKEFGMTNHNAQDSVEDMTLMLESFAITSVGRSLAPVRRELAQARKQSRQANSSISTSEQRLADNFDNDLNSVEDISNEQLQRILRDNKDNSRIQDMAFKELAARYTDDLDNTHSIVPTVSEVRKRAEKILDDGLPDVDSKPAAINAAMESFDDAIDRAGKSMGAEAMQSNVNSSIAGVSDQGLTIMGDILEGAGVRLSKDRPITSQFEELVQAGKVDGKIFKQYSNKYGMSSEELIDALGGNATEAAREMAKRSHLARRLNALVRNVPGGDAMLEELSTLGKGIHSNQRLRNWYDHVKRFDNARIGMLTSALTTTMRNVSGNTLRLGVDAGVNAMDNSLRAMFGLPGEKNPIQGFRTIARLMHPAKNKAEADRILAAFPAEHDLMFSTYASDIRLGGGSNTFWNQVDKGVAAVNVLNRLQDYTIRRAVFLSELDNGLKKAGKSLDDVIDNDSLAGVSREMVQSAVDKSLDLTFTKQFRKGPDAPVFDHVAANVIDAVKSLPTVPVVGTADYPFIRFGLNSLDFFLEHQPTQVLRYMNKAERQAFRAGDTSMFSKAAAGGILYGSAYQMHKTYNKGNHWYELEKEDGTLVDMRPYQPFANYLFVIDTWRRLEEGRIQDGYLTVNDITEGLSGLKIQPSSGMGKLDGIIEQMAGIKDPTEYPSIMENWAGDIGSSITVPFKTVQQLMTAFDESENILKSHAEDPLFGPAQKNVPILGKNLPNYKSNTRAGDIRKTSSPLMQAFTGITYKDPKNIVEKQLSFHGFKSYRMGFRSPDKVLNQFVNGKMGEFVEQTVIPILDGQGYKGMSQALQAKTLKDLMSKSRQAGMKLAIADKAKGDEMLQRIMINEQGKMSSTDRAVFNELTNDMKIVEIIRLITQGD